MRGFIDNGVVHLFGRGFWLTLNSFIANRPVVA